MRILDTQFDGTMEIKYDYKTNKFSCSDSRRSIYDIKYNIRKMLEIVEEQIQEENNQ
jgi:hypothetical protein